MICLDLNYLKTHTHIHPKVCFFFYQLHVLKKETLDINYYLEKENSV